MRSASAGAMRNRLSSSLEAINPEPAVGIEHHLDDARVFEVTRNRRTQRRAQHARAAGQGFQSERNCRHVFMPRYLASKEEIDQRAH